MCQAAELYRFKLPAMDAATALNKLADISGYSLIYPSNDSIVIITNPLFGIYSLADALDKLLLNTPLNAITTEKRVIVVSSILNNYNDLEDFEIRVSIKNQLKNQMNNVLNGALITAGPFSSDAENEEPSTNAEVERIQIIGSRRINRSPSDALAPLDVINKQMLRSQGSSDIISTLSNVVPSYNVNQEAISDAGTMVRPANLRGLPTDSTLILINGKRRHRSGVIYEYISGINVGAHGVDLEPIPSIALKSVEVLRDGAAAQYGSDAIAGVINFRLENSADANHIQMAIGQYYDGDGTKYELSGIFGSNIGDSGTANFSFELSESDATSRGIQDPAVQQLVDSGISKNDIQDPVVNWGAPKITNNIKLFGNMEMDIGDSSNYKQFYLFGNWAQRHVDGSFFYRNPNTRASVFTNPNNGTRLFFDMTNNNSGNCPTPTIPGSSGDAEALAAVSANANCFAFNERFPGGFTPRFGGRITDASIAAGIRGSLNKKEADLTYDISMVVGINDVDYELRNSVNASLGENSPSDFHLGSQIQTESVFNADFTFPVEVGFESELNIAFGYQNHFEQFEVVAGDKPSYQTGDFSNNGEAIGSNGFPGFSPDTADVNGRISNAVYLDIEGDITETLSMSFAIRYEDISKIGNTFDSKLSARLQVTDAMALRSTLSTGFRAPTVGQSTLQRISTSNSIVGDVVVQQTSQLVSALSPIAAARSGGGLKPETAASFSVGILSEIGPVNVTLDYFHIKVDDRLSLFASEITASDEQLLIDSGVNSNVTNIQYYANDFNSTTQGFDLVANIPFELMSGNDLLSLAFNYTNTELDGTNATSPISNVNVLKEREEGIPKNRAVLTYSRSQGDISAMVRINYYGSFYNAQFNDVSLIEKVDYVVITDMELSYDITDSLVVALGAKNIFDVFPKEYSEGRSPGFLGAIYPLNSPSGFNGGYYYFRMGWDF
ncbi:TonB-dependent receptor plug domain-containing protein [Colwellia sp. 12G3]|uniref:TonB-dependent receptor plug domain-containing protein n=1 Tax=Colwellia sp. 12G3 TaxID=2058299 RepID=UPI0012FEC141|nr:TonB-dependent receptor [Colwellia sp. 12G3]